MSKINDKIFDMLSDIRERIARMETKQTIMCTSQTNLTNKMDDLKKHVNDEIKCMDTRLTSLENANIEWNVWKKILFGLGALALGYGLNLLFNYIGSLLGV